MVLQAKLYLVDIVWVKQIVKSSDTYNIYIRIIQQILINKGEFPFTNKCK